MTNRVVSSGQTVSGLVVNPGDTLEVKSGGIAIGTVVSGGETVTIDAGGLTQGTVFVTGGSETVSGTASGTVLNGYAYESVSSGGLASGTIVSSGYVAAVGGTVLGAVINSGSQLYDYNYSGSTVSGTVVKSGGLISILAGSPVSGTVLNGGTEYVYSGATAVKTTVSSGGQEIVYSGGTASATTVLSGGAQHVSGGGTQVGTIVSSGGVQTVQHFYIVSSGQTVSGLVLIPADTLEVKSGGIAIGTVVSGGDTVTIDAGGATQGTVFVTGGSETVSGTASGTVLNGYAYEYVSSGGLASGTIVSSGYVAAVGGTVLGAVINSGSQLYDYNYSGSTVSGTVVKSGGQISILAGSPVSGTVLSGGTEYVDSGATAVKTTVASGGQEIVYSGGTATSTTVLSGGAQHVSGGGTQVGTIVSSGGIQTIQHFYIVSSGQTVSGLVLNPADTLEVKSGGVAIGTVVSGGDTVTIDAGGVTQGTVFVSGGSETISGTANGTVLNGYAYEYVYSGALASGTIVSSGYVAAEGGTVLGAVVNSGSQLYDYNTSGSTVSGTVVKSGGQISIQAGSATGTVLSGGTEYVYGGATAVKTIVSSGGQEIVYSGGIASSATVLSGGAQHVSGGGTQVGTVVSSGGVQTIQHFYIVSSGQTVSGLVLNPADTLEVKSGGVAIGTVVSGGDTVIIDAGGLTQGTVFVSGGSETVSGTASGTVLNGYAYEYVYSGALASGTIVSSGYVAADGGTVLGAVVNSGSQLYDYNTSGSTVSGIVVKSGGQISIAGGSATGTVLSGGTAYVYGGATAGKTTVANGGLEVVYSGGTASATTVLSGGQLHISGGGIDVGTVVSSGGFQEGGTAGPIFLTVLTVSSATIGTTGSIAVTYQNVGAVSVAAPIIELSSDGAMISASGSTGSTGPSVTFLGTGYSTVGALAPGESETAYFSFTPTGTVAGTSFSFSVGTPTPGQSLDLASLEASLKPANVDAADWANVSSAFAAVVGTTTTSFNAALAQEATELALAGAPTTDVPTLLQYEILQASGGLQPSPLVSAVDLVGAGSLAALQLSRVYQGTLVTRAAPGLFGTGWTSPYDSFATTDASGNVFITTLGSVHAFSLQPNGTYVSATGNTETLTVKNGITTLTDADSNVTQFLANGKFSSITDTSGNAITAHWTTSGTLGSLTSSDGETITVTTNAAGRVTKAVDSSGQSVSYTYDTTGTQLLSATGPSGTTSYAYSTAIGTLSAGALTAVTAPDGTQQSFSYDAQGRLASESGASGYGLVSYTYPTAGEMVETDALGNATTLLFNAEGEVAKETDALGNSVKLAYNSAGQVTSATTAAGTSTYSYDSLGNLISYTNPAYQTVTATYATGTNQLTSVTDGRGDTIAYGYDSAGHVGAIVYQDSSGATYKYGANGLLASSKDPAGRTTTYTYDKAGDLTKESFADGTSQSYTYDTAGNLLTATATDGGVTTYTYNSARQLLSVTDASNRVESYAYNTVGLLAQRTEPDGSVTKYGYDANGRLTSLRDGAGALLESYTYNVAGQLTGETKGNGTTTAYTYDTAGRTTGILNSNSDGTTAGNYRYSYNTASQVSQVVTTDGTWTYGYDTAGELIKANFASTNAAISNQAFSYTYDNAGNRTSSTANGIVTSYTSNSLNQYTSVGGTVYTYDVEGDLISTANSAGKTTYSWNDAGELIEVDSPSVTTKYKYDASGNVIATTQNGVKTEDVVDPLSLKLPGSTVFSSISQVYDSSGSLIANLTYGADGLVSNITATGSYFYNTDITKNVVSLTSSSGSVVDSYDYAPFGKTIFQTGSLQNSFQFAGGLGDTTDGTGLVYDRARYYDATTGRFLSEDPFGIKGGSNLYEYAGNDPTLYSDPLGLFFFNLGFAGGYLGGYTGGVIIGSDGIFVYNGLGATSPGVGASLTFSTGSASAGLGFTGQGAFGPGVVGIAGSADFDENGVYTGYEVGVGVGLGGSKVTGAGYYATYTTPIFTPSPKTPTQPKPSGTINKPVILTPVPLSSNNGTNTGKAGALGCPHFTTFDGQNFDFQGAGEFIAARSTLAGDTFQVQLRIEPEGSSDSSVSIITQIAIQVGTDRVTFAVPQYGEAARPQVVWLNGKPSTLSATSPTLALAGGTVTEVSSNEYQVALTTGETVTVNPFGDGMGFNIALPTNAAAGSVQGFLGPDKGQASDFSLPDGTVLKQPLTQTQLYQQFADAWRVTDASSLLDYATGQTTASFTNSQYPRQILTLADFPADLVAKAAALVKAAGITDPTLAADAEFDYISMGNPSFITEDATVAGSTLTSATQAMVTTTTTPAPSIGVLPVNAAVSEGSGTTTPVTFEVNLTSAATVDTVVNYQVTAGVDYLSNTAGKVFFTAADFGGTLPNGSVTVIAGQTAAMVTVAVPNAALGTASAKWLGVTITTPGTDPIYDPTAQAEVLNSTPVAGTPAVPVFKLLTTLSSVVNGSLPTLTQSGTTYTLDLGQLTGGTTAPLLKFALANAAAPGSDSILTQILSTTGTGYQVTATQPSTAILAGSSYAGLSLQPVTTAIGAQSETITFSAADTNSSGYSAALPNMTLVVKDTVVAPNGTTPTISGVKTSQSTSLEKPVTLFAAVTVADSNSGSPTETLTIVQTGTGSLSGTGLVTGTAGTYTLTGTAAALSTQLAALMFTPVAGAPGSSTTTSFVLSDISSAANVAATATTAVTNSDTAPVVTLATSPTASNAATATLGTAVPVVSTDALTVTLVSDAAFATGSTLTLTNGKLIYTPGTITAAKAGSDTLNYKVTDTVNGTATTETQLVNLVSATTPPPTGGPTIVNIPGGGSYQYVFNPTSTVLETIATYSGSNATGTLISTIVDNTGGTSLLYAYNPLSTVTLTAAKYAGTNAANGAPAGQQISDVVDNTDGTVLVYAYNPTTTVTQTAAKYSATNAADGSPAGHQISDVVDNTDGTVLVYSYNPSSTVLQVTNKFSAANADGSPTGTQLSSVVDNTDGTSLIYAYNPTSTVALTATKYSGTNADGSPTGSMVSVVLDYTSGQSAITSYGADGTPSTAYYSGPDGTGTSLLSAQSALLTSDASVGETIAVTLSSQTIDPGAANATIQFLTGATNDTVTLYPSTLDQLVNFDPATDILGTEKLFTATGIPTPITPTALTGYLTITDQGSNANLNFDPTGQGGGSTVAVLQGLAATVTDARQLLYKTS